MAVVSCLAGGWVTAGLVAGPGRAQGAGETAALRLEHRMAPGTSVRSVTEVVSRRSRAIVMRGGSTRASEALAERVVLAASARQEQLNELRQCVAPLAGGGFAVAWIDGIPPEQQTVRLQYVAEDGELAFADGGLVLADGPAGWAVLVPHPTSGVLVAFVRFDDPARSQVIVQWVDREGQTRWSSTGVSAFGPLAPIEQDYHSEPKLLATPGGGVFVCAPRLRPGLETPIVCQSLSPEGLPRWPVEGVTAGGRAGLKFLPRLVDDGEGGLLVLWWNNRFGHDSDRVLIEGQRFSVDGVRQWGELGKVIHRTNLLPFVYVVQNQIEATADGAGGAVVVFDDWLGSVPASLDVVAQRVTREGRLLWGRGVAVAAGRVQQQLDSLIATGDGGAVVTVWEPRRATRGPLRSYRLLGSGAHGWGRAGKPLSDPAATALDFGSYGFVDGGRLRIAWVHQEAPASADFDLRLAELTSSGRRLTPPAGVPFFSGPQAEFLRGFVQAPQSGALFAVFEDVTFEGQGMVEWDVGGALGGPGTPPVH
jgi:hypothetical protein